MESHGKQLHVNGWSMIVHTAQKAPTAPWELSISSIRKGETYREDWDGPVGYLSEEDAHAAAEQWAQSALV